MADKRLLPSLAIGFLPVWVAKPLWREAGIRNSAGQFCPLPLAPEEVAMPLFEVETEAHIIITWAADDDAATEVVNDAYPGERLIRMTKRPRDTWVISKSALGLTGRIDPCNTARDCLSKAAGDKVHAIRLYMHETGTDLERARKVIESNMVMGW
jgi:hypothetical protein